MSKNVFTVVLDSFSVVLAFNLKINILCVTYPADCFSNFIMFPKARVWGWGAGD